MKSFRLIAYLLVLIISSLLQGCGSGSGNNTNGSLSVSDLTITDQTGGTYLVSGTATYTPPSGKEPTGEQISFNASFRTPTGTPTIRSNTVYLDSTGIAQFPAYFITQGTEPVLVTVMASIGGLSAQKSSSVPAIASLSATPSPLVFALTDTSKTVVLSGGFTPYTPSITVADLSVTLSGTTTLIVTKTTATGVIQKFATITVTDSRSNTLSIPVTYF